MERFPLFCYLTCYIKWHHQYLFLKYFVNMFHCFFKYILSRENVPLLLVVMGDFKCFYLGQKLKYSTKVGIWINVAKFPNMRFHICRMNAHRSPPWAKSNTMAGIKKLASRWKNNKKNILDGGLKARWNP